MRVAWAGEAASLAFERATLRYPAAATPQQHSPLISKQNTISVGKYLVSPISKRLDDGRYGASVSIRSGHGSASTDRVMRFTGQFDSEGAADQFACEQGLIWVSLSTPLSCHAHT